MKKLIFIVLFLAGVMAISSCVEAPQQSGDCGDCTPWIEIGCGLGDCDDDEMRLERTCTGVYASDERPNIYDPEDMPLKSLADVPAGCVESCVYDEGCGIDYDCVNPYSLREEETLYIGSNTIYVEGIFDDMVILSINGETILMNRGDLIYIQDIFLTVYAVGYNPDHPEDSATILYIAANEGDSDCIGSYSLGNEETIYIGSHVLNVGSIFQDRVEIWIDNDNHEFMYEGEVGFFLNSAFVYVEDIAYSENVQDSRVLLKAAGSNDPQQVIEYPYYVEIENEYELSGTVEEDIMMFTAIGWQGENKGFKVGSIETGRVAVVVPTGVRGLWGPIYYENIDGDWIEASAGTQTFKIWPANQEMWAQVHYNPFEGQVGISGNLLPDNAVLVRWMSTGVCDLSGFEYFGFVEDGSEADELYIWNLEGSGECGESGYYGNCEEEVPVGAYMVIHNPDMYFNQDGFTFSFYL